MSKPICKYCGKECKLAPSQKKRSRVVRTQCNSCGVTKRRWKTKLEMVEAKGGKCERCGWSGHPGGFQFHHKDPSKKEFTISGNGLLLKERWSELDKCELLCACCHSIEHSNTELIKRMGLLQ
jgi:hypothetical protein